MAQRTAYLPAMSRLLYLLPLVPLAFLVAFGARGLLSDQAQAPSALLSEPVPALGLEPLDGFGPALAEADLRGRWSLLNVFGSWCAYCTVEHPFLMALAEDGVPIFGIDWRDPPGAGEAWLARHGNPYVKVGADRTSRTILDLGVTGAPETFLVDAQGMVRHRHQGPLTERVWRQEFLPRIEAMGAPAPAPDAA